MVNPMLTALNSQNLGRIKQIMSVMKNAGNPQAMLLSMASQNPKMKQIIDMVGNGDPKQIFENACKSRNVDPNDILSMMR